MFHKFLLFNMFNLIDFFICTSFFIHLVYNFFIPVKNVWITKLNNHQVNHYIQNVDKFLVSDKIESLTIDGNVILKTVTGVSKINDIDFEKLMKNVSITTYLQITKNEVF